MAEQPKPYYTQTTKTVVQQITELEITGNIIPMQWFKRITFKAEGKKGKVRPHLLAINILADIVYWYKAKEMRDERSGQVRKYEKKFAGHKLQRSYGQLANTFGVSKEQARIACKVLESHGLIKMELKNLNIEKRKLINVLFMEPVPAKIAEFTYEKISGDSGNFRGGYGEISGEGMAKFPDTYTEITSTEISNTQTSIQKEKQTETGSESSNPDKQTKVTLTKEQDTPEKRKISHAESNQSTIPSRTIGSDSEKPVRSISPKERFLEIHRQIANEINLGRRIIEDISALPEIVEILEESTEKFTQLCRFYLADEFYRDKGFSQKSLLSCLNNRNVFAVEPVKKTAYNTRDYNSPEHKAEIAKIVQAAENRQKGIVPEQAPRKTLAQAVKERMAREKLAKEMEELKHAV